MPQGFAARLYFIHSSPEHKTQVISPGLFRPPSTPTCPPQPPLSPRALGYTHMCWEEAAGAEGSSVPPAFHALLEGAPRSAAAALLITTAEN